MSNDWVMDVLTDLKTFARANGLYNLAEQLDDTYMIAMSEFAAKKTEKFRHYNDGKRKIGTYFGGAGESHTS